tara:strand:- start:24839 stop:25015 length:177 start_codon:yes stop_codon:yes gene_type:complete
MEEYVVLVCERRTPCVLQTIIRTAIVQGIAEARSVKEQFKQAYGAYDNVSVKIVKEVE